MGNRERKLHVPSPCKVGIKQSVQYKQSVNWSFQVYLLNFWGLKCTWVKARIVTYFYTSYQIRQSFSSELWAYALLCCIQIYVFINDKPTWSGLCKEVFSWYVFSFLKTLAILAVLNKRMWKEKELYLECTWCLTEIWIKLILFTW